MNILHYAGYFSLFLIFIQIINELILLISPAKKSFWSRKYFTWKEVNKQISKIAEQIKNKNKHYGLICGTGRGGAILGSLLSYKLDLTPILSFDRKYIINGENSNLTSRCIINEVALSDADQDLKSKPVLLITPQSDPGVTLNKYKEILRESGFTGSIDKCAILKSDRSLDTNIEYFIYSYSTAQKCRKFPWEKNSPNLMDKREEV